jgi:gamma-glutamyl:cysteine ligase YbdK (ATP-grasp superfamily)
MGQEIAHDHFSPEDWQEYARRLDTETRLLREMLEAGEFSSQPAVGGFELEGWLVDPHFRPAPRHAEFLQALNSPLATTELAKFNIELNTQPCPLTASALSDFETSLRDLLERADVAAAEAGVQLMLIGMLPTTVQGDFCLETMAASNRYRVLNAEVLKARHGRPLRMEIDGYESLHIQHDSVMLEAATTSFQVHMQLAAETAHHFYNAAIIASAPIMAVAGNSPFLFGRALWEETRIPVFEQAVDAGREFPARVSFGSGFADKSIAECFEENLEIYPVLLPELQDKPAERFAHLRLHNGVTWRWNRPLVGFDPDGTPHIRVEHRILPAGPSVPDMMANAALFYGLTQYLGMQLCAGEPIPMAFATARENFYNAARIGLEAQLRWQRQEWRVQDLMLDELLPQAAEGLEQLGIADDDIRHYLSIIAARIETGQTGAVWQQQHLERTQGSFYRLLLDYARLQRTHTPVHTWTLDC